MSELLCCPNLFCKSTIVYLRAFPADVGHGAVWPEHFAVKCPECGLLGPKGLDEESAKKSWNERLAADVVIANLQAEVARLRDTIYVIRNERDTALLQSRDEEAKRLYNDMINNHPTIHTNRFPGWDELLALEKDEWRQKVK